MESFRKSSSGTQTDISALRNKKKEAMETSANTNSNSTTTNSTTNNNNNTVVNSTTNTTTRNSSDVKYTGQYKKHAAPHKPARKHKPKSSGDQANQGESRSDRSASPDNSSTSGYSSPSAGLHSKESSPCGSKIPSPPHSLEQTPNDEADNANNEMGEEELLEEEEAVSTNTSQEELDRHDDSGRLLDENITEEDYEDEEDMDDGEVDHRITVIQIEGQDKENKKDTHSTGSESNYSERSSSPPIGNGSIGGNFPDGKLLDQNHNSNTLPLVRTTRRELPRIVTNGTLGRPSSMNSHQSYPTKNRRLPDRSHFQTNNHPAQEPPAAAPQLQNIPSRYFQPQQRIYRSNLPRPAPIHHFGPAGRVPLPPVPELERSDHERESMSPTPSSVPSPRSSTSASVSGLGGSGNPMGGGTSSNNNNNSHVYRPLPSPLSTPVQPSTIGPRVQAKPRRGLLRNAGDHHQQKTSSPSRIPRATSSSERDFSPSSSQRFHSQQLPPPMPSSKADLETKGKVVDERLRVLLSLLESGKENATDHGREDTLQYLSQLESVARRLKDQLLQDAPNSVPRHGSQVQ